MKLAFVYVSLLALLGATYAVSFFDLGSVNVWLNVGIAVVKTLLVLAFFMRIRSVPLARSVMLTAVWFLAVLYWLSGDDYFTRPRSEPPSTQSVLHP